MSVVLSNIVQLLPTLERIKKSDALEVLPCDGQTLLGFIALEWSGFDNGSLK